ncbi:phosphotransferase [Alteromonas gracilis]|uniref:phosphotransferase n=1 Tax=Alteromonas gracilis TaxID=1479524 RepID=UPI003735C5FB
MDIIARVQKALRLSDNIQVSQHPSGAVNHVYRVQDNVVNKQLSDEFSRDFAVKWMGNDDFSGVNRAHQFALQQQLFKLGIAPQPLWLSDDETIWVEQWLENTSNPELTPKQLATALALIHQLPVTARPLELAARWQHYIKAAALDEDSFLFKKAQALRSNVIQSEQNDQDYVLCHNDLLINHLMLTPNNELKVIDWEYAAMGNRYFDLASCGLINKLSKASSLDLVKHYASVMNIDENYAVKNFELHVDIVEVTNDLWFAALEKGKKHDTELKSTVFE